MNYKDLIGKEVRGFKFESITNGLSYNTCMDIHIGEVGEITHIERNWCQVDFKDDFWQYPISEVRNHLVDNAPYQKNEIGKEYFFWNGEGHILVKGKLLATVDHEYKYIVDDGGRLPMAFRKIEPITEELPKEGLLVSEFDSLVYKLSDSSGYGFISGCLSDYFFNKGWDFSTDDHWRKATPEEEKQFCELLKKELEKRGLFEDTKIESHANSGEKTDSDWRFHKQYLPSICFNENGCIFYKGKFATPKRDLLNEVSQVVSKELKNVIIENKDGVIIIKSI